MVSPSSLPAIEKQNIDLSNWGKYHPNLRDKLMNMFRHVIEQNNHEDVGLGPEKSWHTQVPLTYKNILKYHHENHPPTAKNYPFTHILPRY